MRHLISSLQNHNHQLKGDVQRYKRKLREVQAEINKVGLPGERLKGDWAIRSIGFHPFSPAWFGFGKDAVRLQNLGPEDWQVVSIFFYFH